jgi:hypothetical protein
MHGVDHWVWLPARTFEVHEYEHDEASASYGLEAAERLGLDPARVFKTLLAAVDGELRVCILPVASNPPSPKRRSSSAPAGEGSNSSSRRPTSPR